MKKYFTLVLVFVVFFTTSTLFSAEPQTKAGSKSLYFGLNGLSDLGVDNSVLGGQYLFQDNMGIWLELGFNSSNNKPYENATEQKYSSVGVDVGFIYYAFQKGPIAVYFSPQLGFASGTDDNGTTKITTSSFTGGISLGAEWWAFENVSLSASVLLGYSNSKVKTEAGSNSTEATTNNFGILGSTNSKFLVSFYF